MTVLYYKTSDGRVIENCDVENAYYIATGKRRCNDEIGYSKFLYRTLGKSIVGVVNPKDDEVMKDGFIKAVKKYREDHGCSLTEAHQAVSAYRLALFE